MSYPTRKGKKKSARFGNSAVSFQYHIVPMNCLIPVTYRQVLKTSASAPLLLKHDDDIHKSKHVKSTKERMSLYFQ